MQEMASFQKTPGGNYCLTRKTPNDKQIPWAFLPLDDRCASHVNCYQGLDEVVIENTVSMLGCRLSPTVRH